MQLNDINISIGKDKIRTGAIFLLGFVTGGLTLTVTAKSKIKKNVERKAFKQIEESQGLANEAVNRACEAIDKLTEKTKNLEAAVVEECIRSTINMEAR